MLKITIINGPNLNLLGMREPTIYGSESFLEFFEKLKNNFPDVEFTYVQSNVEGEIINFLHDGIGKVDGFVINPGGYSHTSVAIADAMKAVQIPIIEVHISNIYKRESYRHVSITGASSIGVISGLGLSGYELAITHLKQILQKK